MYTCGLTLLLLFSSIIFEQTCMANGQNLQQLSYANADIGGKLIRSTTPTQFPPVTTSTTTTTTEKTGFFGGIRNIFSRKSTTKAPTVSSTLAASIISTPSTTQPTPLNRNNVITQSITATTTTKTTQTPTQTQSTNTQKPIQSTLNAIASVQSTSTTSSPTIAHSITSKPSKSHEDFPALPTPKNSFVPVNSIVPSPPPPSSVWSIPTLNITSSTTVLPERRRHHGTDTTRTTTIRPGIQAKNDGTSDVTDTEITELTEALFQKEKSDNLFKYITLNYQGHTYSSAKTDEAPEPLISIQNVTILNTVPTIEKMRLLYNNYELDAAVNEHVTPMERIEESDLVNALLETPLIRKAMLFLEQKGKVTPDVKTHRELLKTIWFKLYSRGHGKIGSSGFEHVFLAELKNGDISGLHNWIYFYEEEVAGRINYMGYMKKLELGDKGAIVKIRFEYNGHIKPSNTIFIGTSPELEIALYTLCFKLRPDASCPISLGGKQFNIRTYTFRYRGSDLIGSAFAEI